MIKNVIKRVLIVVLSFLIISFIKSCDVFALNIQPYQVVAIDNSNHIFNSCRVFTQFGVQYSDCSNTSSSGIVSPLKSEVFYYQNIDWGLNGYLDISFSFDGFEPSVIKLQTRGTNYSCSFEGPAEEGLYNVYCNNIPVSPNIIIRVFYKDSYEYYDSLTLSHSTNSISYSFSAYPNQVSVQQDTNNKLDDVSDKIQDTNDKLDDLNDSITDKNVDDDNLSFGGILDIETTEPFGLSAIVTAPLRLLDSARSSCSPISFRIFSNDITLPCGDTLFWNHDFSTDDYDSPFNSTPQFLNLTRNTFRIFWNTLVGGFILFNLLSLLLKAFNKALDPFDDSFGTLADVGNNKNTRTKPMLEVKIYDV